MKIPAALLTSLATSAIAAASRVHHLQSLSPGTIVQVHEAFADTPQASIANDGTPQVKMHYTGRGDKTEVSTLIGFDIPSTSTAKRCALNIYFPPSDAQPGWTVHNSGWFDAWPIADGKVAHGVTTWKTKPRWTGPALFRFFQTPEGGEARVVGNPIQCAAGDRLQFELSPAKDRPMSLEWDEAEDQPPRITLEMWG